MKKILVWVIILLVVGFGMFVFLKSSKKAEKEEEVIIPVRIGKVEFSNFIEKLNGSGTVQAENEVNVSAKVGGRVEKIYVDEGSYVNQGQILLELEKKELKAGVEQAKAAVALAESRLQLALSGARKQERKLVENAVEQAKKGFETAESNFNRMKSLYEEGVVSKQQFEMVELNYKVAKEQYDSAKQQLSLVEEGAREEDINAAKAGVDQAKAALKLAETMLENAIVYAPISGEISMRSPEIGELIGPGIPLFTIVDNRKVYVEITVNEKNIKDVKKGAKAIVEVDSVGEKKFIGEVKEINPAADPLTRSFKVKVYVPNPERILKAGTFARVSIETHIYNDVILIPRETVQLRGKRNVVFKIENNVAREVPVKLGAYSQDKIIVLDGLDKDDEIVFSGQDKLGEGVRVVITK